MLSLYPEDRTGKQEGESTMKKSTVKKGLIIIFAVFLTFSALTGCAGRKPMPEQNNVAGQNGELAVGQTTTLTTEELSPSVSLQNSAAYEKLAAYKTGDYSRQSVAEFNATLAATPDELTEFLTLYADVTAFPEDENYGFFSTTLRFSSNEMYCESRGEGFAFFTNIEKKSRLCNYLDEYGDPVYGFYCTAEMNVGYAINGEKLTVGERDAILLTFQEEMQNYLDSLSETEITDGDIKTMLTDKSAELINSLSTDNMKLLSCEVYLCDIITSA